MGAKRIVINGPRLIFSANTKAGVSLWENQSLKVGDEKNDFTAGD